MRRIIIISSLNVWSISPVKTWGQELFFVRRFQKITDSFSLLVIGLLRLKKTRLIYFRKKGGRERGREPSSRLPAECRSLM